MVFIGTEQIQIQTPRVIRLLDDFEVSSILEKLNIESPNRQGGNKTLEELGF